jgi:hypothetical protein
MPVALLACSRFPLVVEEDCRGCGGVMQRCQTSEWTELDECGIGQCEDREIDMHRRQVKSKLLPWWMAAEVLPLIAVTRGRRAGGDSERLGFAD